MERDLRVRRRRMAGAAIAAAAWALATTPAAAADFLRFTHPQHGYSMLVPGDWRNEPNPNDADLRQVSDAAGCFLQASSAPLARYVAPEAFLRAFEAESMGPDRYYRRRLSDGPRSLAGQPGWQAAYDMVHGPDPMRGRLALLTTQDRVYLLLLVCRRDTFDRVAPLLDAVAGSFTLPAAAAAQAAPPARPAPPPPSAPAAADGYLGIAIRALSDEEARLLGLGSRGVVLVAQVDEGRAAAAAGIEPGDVLVQIGNRPTPAMADVRGAPTPAGRPLDVTVLRRGELRHFTLVPGPRPPVDTPRPDFVVLGAAGVVMEQQQAWARSADAAGRVALTMPAADGGVPARIEVDRLPPATSKERAVGEAAIHAKRQVTQQFKGARIFDGPAYVQPPAARAAPGAQFEAEYRSAGAAMRRWVVILPDGRGGAVIWSYAAAEPAFDAHLGEAKAMLRGLIVFARPVP